MDSKDIRQKFLDYFKEQEHTIVPSSPLIPAGDPTLLFANAGMNQFKDYFLGKAEAPYNRAASAQKCMRVSGKHNDLEEVGHDGTHHTFFEMMGNWSFGDYFKRDAIEMAWELIVDKFGLDPDRLWASVYREDDEAEKIWRKILPAERVLRFGEKENFWEMAEIGPCGPCSEIHYDLKIGSGERPNDPGGRFVEIWNLVFMEFYKDESGKLEPLPKQNVDTGLGLERVVAILQGVDENYETDLFAPIIASIEDITGADFENPDHRVAIRVIADHTRALAFTIADGALPGNEGRGYVLRRLLRRAARFSRKLGYHEPIIYRIVAPLTDVMGEVYPELISKNEHIVRAIRAEEENFAQTLDVGIELFEEISKKAIESGDRTIWGADAFKLYDTYGFPLDLTDLMASEAGLVVDRVGFEKEMEIQRERSRASAKFKVSDEIGPRKWVEITEGSDSEFIGYEKTESGAQLRRYRIDDDGKARVILDKTPFYAETGGQVGDTGEIVGDGWSMRVTDTIKEADSFVHTGELEGEIGGSPDVIARIDTERRKAIMRNHTATHLLQFALRKVLGEHVHQSGSYVAPDRLRFDYTHFEAPSPEQLRKIERIVNEVAVADIPVFAREMPYREALDKGAIALFGEKYGEKVRVISIEPVSMELCGGTHISRTGEIGAFIIRSESSIGSGLRRIEAVTGTGVIDWANEIREITKELTETLKVAPDELVEKVRELIAGQKKLNNEIDELKRFIAGDTADGLVSKARELPGGRYVVEQVVVESRDDLAELNDEIKKRLGSGVVFLLADIDGKLALVASATKDIVEKGISAGELIRGVTAITGGSGGGRPDFAQGGGKDTSLASEALSWVKDQLKTKLGG
ncbi:alanine--tRNA ligase [bacterium]|nr:MAG: alanine--tRNA ligase [bacterium]